MSDQIKKPVEAPKQPNAVELSDERLDGVVGGAAPIPVVQPVEPVVALHVRKAGGDLVDY